MHPILLHDLLHAVGIKSTVTSNPIITSVAIDSRKVKAGSLFVALPGTHENGFNYAAAAIGQGAVAILCEQGSGQSIGSLSVPVVEVAGSRKYAGPLLNVSAGKPTEKLFSVGVTGTNGKSTITRLATSILKAAGHRVISLGTIDYRLDDEVIPSVLTTPGGDQFYELLARGVMKGCTALAMEVSSHALSQDRVGGMQFERAIFTNLTQDHLDFHSDFEDYYQAKRRLFFNYMNPKGTAIINLDSEYGLRLKKEIHCDTITFAQHQAANLVLERADLALSESVLTLRFGQKVFQVKSALVGSINLENLLAAVALGLSLSLSESQIAMALASVTVPGRNEVTALPQGAFAVIDYAHTPDALERVLKSLRALTPGKLISVFGCGGDRDKTKRPLMGAIAARLSDRVVLTSDNPRTEKAEDILDQIAVGVDIKSRNHVTRITDRAEAIRHALKQAGVGDCVLIAGKGHEDYQIIGKVKRPYSDQDQVAAFIAEVGVAS